MNGMPFQRPEDLSDRKLKIDIPEPNVHARLRMLVGAINNVRVTCNDSDISKILTQILLAGGVLVDDD